MAGVVAHVERSSIEIVVRSLHPIRVSGVVSCGIPISGFVRAIILFVWRLVIMVNEMDSNGVCISVEETFDNPWVEVWVTTPYRAQRGTTIRDADALREISEMFEKAADAIEDDHD